MPVTSYHSETGKWLTSFGPEARAGDIRTISYGSRSKTKGGAFGPHSCEFTTYLLCDPEAVDKWGEPLFDDDKCVRVCPLDYDGYPTAEKLLAIASA